MKKTPYLIGLVIAFAIGGLVPTLPLVVLAQSGTTDYIHACVKNSNGSLRIETPGVDCNSNESALDWAKNGAAGSQFPFTCPGCLFRDKAGDLLKGKDLTNAMLFAADLAGTDLQGTILTGAMLEQASFGGANLTSADLTDAQLSLAGLQGANLTGTNFTRAILRNITLSFTYATSAVFVDADLTALMANFADFSLANFTGANLTDASLLGANFTGATLSNVTWSNTTCPDGTNSDDNGGTCLGHLTL